MRARERQFGGKKKRSAKRNLKYSEISTAARAINIISNTFWLLPDNPLNHRTINVESYLIHIFGRAAAYARVFIYMYGIPQHSSYTDVRVYFYRLSFSLADLLLPAPSSL